MKIEEAWKLVEQLNAQELDVDISSGVLNREFQWCVHVRRDLEGKPIQFLSFASDPDVCVAIQKAFEKVNA